MWEKEKNKDKLHRFGVAEVKTGKIVGGLGVWDEENKRLTMSNWRYLLYMKQSC